MTAVLWTGFRMHFKMLSRSAFELSVTAIWPLVYASIAYFLYRHGTKGPSSLFYASIGATVMVIWSNVSVGAGNAIQRQRRLGLLEILVASPTPFVVTLVPIALATAAVGVYSFVATIAWGGLLFHVPVTIRHPFLFAIAVPVAIVAIGMLGLLLGSVLVLYRAARAAADALEYPVWLACGLLVPLSVLPGWVAPISWLLAPTWGVRAIRSAALGGAALEAIGMCLVVSVAYLLIALVFLEHFERLARKRASLSLT